MGFESLGSMPTAEEVVADAKEHFNQPPTIEEVHAFFTEAGLELDPEWSRFYHQLLVNHFRVADIV